MNNAYSTTQRVAKFLLAFLVFLAPLSTPTLLAQNCAPAPATRTASNAKSTNTNIYDDIAFVMTNLLGAGTEGAWVLETGGTFVENGDRTAAFTGVIKQFGDYTAPRRFQINLTFGGQTFTAPMGSPYNNTAVPTTDWYYYTSLTGTLTGLDGIAGGVLSLTLNPMHAFQVGTGANQIPDEPLDKVANGAAGWIEWTVVSQPTTGLTFTTYNSATNIADIALLLGGTPSVPTPPCTASAGSTTISNVNLTLNNGSATITGVATTNSTVPTGYQIAYVLTKGASKTIVKTSTTPSFTVTEAGDYCVHVLVYNPATLNLSTIQLGTKTATQVLSTIATNCICASLNATGNCITVTPPTPPNDPCAGIISIRPLSNTFSSCTTGTPYVMYYNSEYYVAGTDLVFTEYTNGTATITGKVVKGGISYVVNILYSSKTTVAPSMSPKYEHCATATNTNNGAGWTYYTTMSGTIQTPAGTVNVTRRGPAFQTGNYANLQQAGLGGSGWFNCGTINGDFNFNLGNAIACPSTPPTCVIPSTPTGWMYLGSFNNSNYYKFTGSGDLNYQAALLKTAAIGGRLTVIKSAAQNAFLQSKLSGGSAWISLSRSGSGWITSEGAATYFNWASGEPNNYNNCENVAQIKSDGQWNDVSQASTNWTIAEIPCNYAPNPCDNDTQAPTFSACPANISLTTATSCAVANWTAPTATDNCGTPSVSSSHTSGFCFSIGTTTVIYTAKDAKNNVKMCSFTVTVTSSVPVCNTNFDPNKCYKIVNKASGKVLDVYGASTCNNTRITQWAGHSGANQQWKFSSVDNGFVKIMSRNSGKYIACHSTTSGSTVYQYDYYTGGYKDWKIECVTGGYYKITHRASGKVLDVENSCLADGGKVQIWDCNNNGNGSNNQLWQIVEVPCATQGSNGNVYATSNIVFNASASAESNRSRIEFLSNEAPQADYYTVKKGNLATGTFETLEIVNNLNTTTNDVQQHASYDNSPKEGDNFYLVEITYLDGSKKETAVQTVNFKGLLEARVFPNPAVDVVQIDLSQYAGNEVSLFIVNQFGQNVRFMPVGLAGKQAYELDLSGIETGNYTVRIVSKGKRDLTKRLVITK